MKYIHVFDTDNEFVSAYTGSDYLEPWVSATIETSGVAYNKMQCPDITPIPAHSSVVISEKEHNVSGPYDFYGYRMCYMDGEDPSTAQPMFIWKESGGDFLVASFLGIPDGEANAFWAYAPDEESEYPCYFTYCGSCPTRFDQPE